MTREALNERYSIRERGPLKLCTFPPHIFPGAASYQIHAGPLKLCFAGRRGRSNTVIYAGRWTIVIPRRWSYSQHHPEQEWKLIVARRTPDDQE